MQTVAGILVLEAIKGKLDLVGILILIAAVGLQYLFIGREHIHGDDVGLSVVVVVGDVIAHTEPGIVSEVFGATLREGAVAVIDIVIIIFMKIIPYIDIIPTIVVEVGDADAKSVSQHALIDACLFGDIGEFASGV